MSHTVAFLAYPGFQILDVTGPAAVFHEANHVQRMAGAAPFYRIVVLSAAGGPVASSSGIELSTRALARMPASAVDTLLVAGAYEEPLTKAIRDPAVRRWVPRCAKSAKRFGSVCSGTFVLASLGLLDGKRVATHWEACPILARLYPNLKVDSDVLYVAEGQTWTSAGVTTGIDMALAMVSRDIDAHTTNSVAKRLVALRASTGSPVAVQSSVASPVERRRSVCRAHRLDSGESRQEPGCAEPCCARRPHGTNFLSELHLRSRPVAGAIHRKRPPGGRANAARARPPAENGRG